MPFDLDRFVQAQSPVYPRVRQELREGRKRTHWMWFVFPQLRGLGGSAMAEHYGLASLAEARAYLEHAVLGPRLVECAEFVNEVRDRSIHEIFGGPDDLKFHSCMTLFASLADAPAAFERALAKYFGRARDPRTAEMLSNDGAEP
jgi:uncharacterized protein (DUF1810 family)